MSGAGAFVEHPRLAACGVRHGFGTRGAVAPAGLRRPRQVHGARAVAVEEAGRESPEADAILSWLPGVPVGVVTADCVPVLIADIAGSWVAAVHAGWRGLARGVVAATARALRARGGDLGRSVAVVGPHVGPCCYEVDAPVVEALESALGAALGPALAPTRADHWSLDLGRAVRCALCAAGWSEERVAALEGVCTACDVAHFHSYRRDGPRAGRLVHFVEVRESAPSQG